MSYSNSIIFGPVPSRRFGMSLGVDLSPSIKQCNFDCLYCELEKAKTVDKQEIVLEVSDIVSEIKEAIDKHPNINVITFTANGEPTLYPKLLELIDEVDKIKGETKTLILTNGGNIYNKTIQQTLSKIDIVKISLDCVSDKCFKKLDRIDSSVDSKQIVDGIAQFKKGFKNQLIIETLFVKTLNDSEEEIKLLKSAYDLIKPHRIDIGTIDRPPAYKVEAVSFESLQAIADKMSGHNIAIAYKNRPKSQEDFSEDEILRLFKRRPLSTEDIDNMFGELSKKRLQELLKNQKIKLVDNNGVKFYKIA